MLAGQTFACATPDQFAPIDIPPKHRMVSLRHLFAILA
jgi:hypothetical protein